MKTALVHDWLNQLGGAEDVLEELVHLYPGTPLYTSLYWRDGMPPIGATGIFARVLSTSCRWHTRSSNFTFRCTQPHLKQFDLRGYDLVLSNKAAFATVSSPGRKRFIFATA